MTSDTKRKTLMLLGLGILVMILIAASLPQLELRPGMPLPRLQEGHLVAAVPADETRVIAVPATDFFLILIILVFAGSVLYSMYRVLRGADWKAIAEVLRPIGVITAVLVCLILVILQLPSSNHSTTVEMVPLPTPAPVLTSPLGAVPAPFPWLVGMGLLVLCVLAGLWIFTSARPAGPIELVGREAEKARQALEAGAGLKNVILHCYRQMSLALKQEQGIEREEFMTTGEFERVLESAGVPHEPIHQLTRLFDAVRYGNWQPNPSDEQTAIQSLEAIMLYSRAARGGK